MEQELYICEANELPVNSRLIFSSTLGFEVIVINHQGQFIAFNRKCSHKGARTDKAVINGSVFICPAHQYEFDLTTGICISHDCLAMKVYPVIQRGTCLYLLAAQTSLIGPQSNKK